MLNNKSTQSIYKLSTFAVGVASFEIASIVSNVCQFVPKPQQRILQFDTHLPRNGISELFRYPNTWIFGYLDNQILGYLDIRLIGYPDNSGS